MITIPKTVRESRICENADAIEKKEISDEDMAMLTGLEDGFHASNATMATNESWEESK